MKNWYGLQGPETLLERYRNGVTVHKIYYKPNGFVNYLKTGRIKVGFQIVGRYRVRR